jgi:hypothetical protein
VGETKIRKRQIVDVKRRVKRFTKVPTQTPRRLNSPQGLRIKALRRRLEVPAARRLSIGSPCCFPARFYQ